MKELKTYFDGFNERDWQTETDTGPIRFAVIDLDESVRNRVLPAIEQADRCETTVVVSGSVAKVNTMTTEIAADHTPTYDELQYGVVPEDYDGYDGFRDLEVVTAAYESAETRSRIPLRGGGLPTRVGRFRRAIRYWKRLSDDD